MKYRNLVLLGLMFLGLMVPTAPADTILFEWAVNLNGAFYTSLDGPIVLGGLDTSAFDDVTGLGVVTMTLTGAGSYNFIAYFDVEIDETVNGFTNEFGASFGTPGLGQSFEIDEPGFAGGDIYDNLLAGALDNTVSAPNGFPDDVAMALGWNFTLSPLDVATIALRLADTAPASGFYLVQTDPDSGGVVYYSGSLDIEFIPEPGTWVLVFTGLAVAAAARRFRRS